MVMSPAGLRTKNYYWQGPAAVYPTDRGGSEVRSQWLPVESLVALLDTTIKQQLVRAEGLVFAVVICRECRLVKALVGS
jgi:hypothetical protein